jgi:hypothetical protein
MVWRQSTTLRTEEILVDAKKRMDHGISCQPKWIKGEDIER